MSIINTETGVVKSYYRDSDTDGEWVIGHGMKISLTHLVVSQLLTNGKTFGEH